MHGRSFFGVILIALGLAFLGDQFGWFSFGSLISTWWPAILILLGVAQFTGQGGGMVPGAGLIAVGAFFLLRRFGWLGADSFRYIWPLFIIFFGLRILFARPGDTNFARPGESGAAGSTDETIDAFTVFSALKTRITAQNFRGGRVTCVFGGGEIDLRDAALDGGRAAIEATVAFGGIEIRVPTGWRIQMTATPLFGGCADETDNRVTAADAPVLQVKAFAAFGGVTVKN